MRCNDDDLKYYEGCESVEVPEGRKPEVDLAQCNPENTSDGHEAIVASVKSYKEYYDSKRDEKEQLAKVQIGSHNSKELIEKIKLFMKEREWVFAPHPAKPESYTGKPFSVLTSDAVPVKQRAYWDLGPSEETPFVLGKLRPKVHTQTWRTYSCT